MPDALQRGDVVRTVDGENRRYWLLTGRPYYSGLKSLGEVVQARELEPVRAHIGGRGYRVCDKSSLALPTSGIDAKMSVREDLIYWD